MPIISSFSNQFKPIGGNLVVVNIESNPQNDFTYVLMPNKDIQYLFIPNDDIDYVTIPNNDNRYSIIQNPDSTYTLIPNDDFNFNILRLPTGNGTTAERAGQSAYQIKTIYPSSTDGLYWIKNDNINEGTPFQIYADMTTDGGGWTLLVTNQNTDGWTYENAVLLNEGNPVISGANYSIVSYADYIKRSESGFEYMLEANERGNWGGIWTANGNYSFVHTGNTQTDVTLSTKFGNWNYAGDGVEQRMPWYSASDGVLTTSESPNGDWWGTIITRGGWTPAPWMNNAGMDNPGIIWYWVR